MKNKEKIFLLIFVCFCIFSCNKKNESKNNDILGENRNQTDYVMTKDTLSKNYTLIEGMSPKEGFVPTANVAFQIAEVILNSIYGEENIAEEKPFSINLEGDIWVIEGTLPQGYDGGVAYIEISKSTGEILKVLHTK